MSKKLVRLCDRCVRIVDTEEIDTTFSVTTGRSTDAAGSVDDEWEDIDLCPSCMSIELNDFLVGLSFPARRDWLRKIHSEAEYRRP